MKLSTMQCHTQLSPAQHLSMYLFVLNLDSSSRLLLRWYGGQRLIADVNISFWFVTDLCHWQCDYWCQTFISSLSQDITNPNQWRIRFQGQIRQLKNLSFLHFLGKRYLVGWDAILWCFPKIFEYFKSFYLYPKLQRFGANFSTQVILELFPQLSKLMRWMLVFHRSWTFGN